MIKHILNHTDNFLCSNVKKIFEKTENRYKKENLNFDLSKELKSLELNPLGCMIGIDSKFETNVKVKIKLLVGFLFVFLPFIIFSLLSYIIGIKLFYTGLLTFIIAIFISSRIEEIAKRYSLSRVAELSY